MPKQYPKDRRDRAVRLVREHRGDYGTEWEAIGSIAKKLGIGSAETLADLTATTTATATATSRSSPDIATSPRPSRDAYGWLG